MKGILAIYRREMHSYFVSPIAYIVVGVFLLLAGFFFYSYTTGIIDYGTQAQMQSMRGGTPPEIDMPGMLLRGFLGITSTIVLFMIPMLTMGMYAEERKRGTMELLMTSPLTEFHIVFGKWLAALTLYLIMLAPTFLYHVIIRFFSDPKLPWKILLSGYLGAILLGAVLIAIGAWISSLTENQIVAAVITFGVFLILLVVDQLVRNSTSMIGEVLSYISILRHYEDFTRGVIDTTSVIFYVTFTILGLFLTLRTLDSMRWRRA
jgi:ABC-2 type transport system permease protein